MGAKPRPIRTRGFYRALRRGELWLVCSYQYIPVGMASQFAKIIPDKHCPPDEMYIVWPFPDRYNTTVTIL